MKAFLVLVLFLVGQPPPPIQGNDAVVEGYVVRFGTSERLPRVDVVARSEDSRQTKILQTRTDDEGNFRIDKVPPGRYSVIPNSPGYSLPPDGVNPISIRKGERIRNINLQLVRDGAIHGRVLQSDGQPVAGISVELVQAAPARNWLKSLMPTNQKKATDGNGDYQFAVVPGEYYIRTVSPSYYLPQSRTYFPDTSEPIEAWEERSAVRRNATGTTRFYAEDRRLSVD